jgi:hypothetical protein
VSEIQYRKLVTDGEYSYWHPYKVVASPKIGIDSRRNPVIFTGRSTVTTHGIEDLPASDFRPERLPPRPRRLILLGRLEWIRFVWEDPAGTSHLYKLSFSRRVHSTSLEHDERGNLHILNGKISPNEAIPMARKHHSHRSHRGHKPRRHNPVELTGHALGRVLVPTLSIGAVGALAAVGADKLLTGPKSATDPTPKYSGYQRAAFEGLGGILAAAALSIAKVPAEVILGVGAIGVTKGILDGYAEYQARAAAAAHQQLASGTSGATAPGARALGAGYGMPAGYYSVNQAACAR